VDAAIAAVVGVLAAVGVPTRLRDIGVDESVLSEVVDHAKDDWVLTTAPRPAAEADLLDLLRSAW
jgi:alcohol dehydrogenase class IV